MESTQVENFEVIKELGRGSFGCVWLVKHEQGNLAVMKKISLINLSPGDRERSEKEVEILSSLKHPNIVSYKGVTKKVDSLCIFMGYCEGGDLHKVIQKQNGCIFPEQRVIRWFIQIVMALLYLHQRNILHRDLKTQNLFLTKSGLIKVGDFGISRHLDSSQDMANTCIGTPFYMSPEILAGVSYNEKSDIWSLGCCLFELLTLRHPFQANDIGSLVFRITRGKTGRIPNCYSEEVANLTRSLLHYKPQERPSAASILQLKFIRNHMETFLSDTKRIERKGSSGSRNSLRSRKRVGRGDPDKLQGVDNPEGEILNKLYFRKKLCEASVEFDSLMINGDKMKLECKSRSDKTEACIRSCNCVRHSREHKRYLYNREDSERRRRNDGTPDRKEKPDLPFQNVPFFSPARERRRQAIRDSLSSPIESAGSPVRVHSPCLDSPEATHHLNGHANGNHFFENSVGTESNSLLDGDESGQDFEDSSDNSSREMKSFSKCLNHTLQSEREAAPAGLSISPSLKSRIQSASEDLDTKIGSESTEKIKLIVNEGNWDEQKTELEALLGEEVFKSVSGLIWTLKLCYELLA